MRGGEKWLEAGKKFDGPTVTRAGPMVGGGGRPGPPRGTRRRRSDLLFVWRGDRGNTDNFVPLATIWRAVARRGEVWSFHFGSISRPESTYITYHVWYHYYVFQAHLIQAGT